MNNVRINIPEIPTVKMPTIPDFSNIKVDTSGINSTVTAAIDCSKSVKRTCLITQLATYKTKTISIMGQSRSLSEEDRIAVEKIITELHANDWLDSSTREWCANNNITVQ